MYSLSSACKLTVKPDLTVVIKNRKTGIAFPAQRWKELTHCVADVEGAVKQLKDKQYVNYRRHIGGAYYLSVTTGFYCVDIRKFVKRGDDIKPTKQGIALRIWEWTQLVNTISQLKKDYPAMNVIVLCSDQLDHMNQLGYMACPECNPHGSFLDM
jgi:hypothetical protein